MNLSEPFDDGEVIDFDSDIQLSKQACDVRGINQKLCDCARWITGSWTDVGQDRSVPYRFDKKISVLKNCPKCQETGIMSLNLTPFQVELVTSGVVEQQTFRLAVDRLRNYGGPHHAAFRKALAAQQPGSEYYIG